MQQAPVPRSAAAHRGESSWGVPYTKQVVMADGARGWGAAAMSWAIRNGLIDGNESGCSTTGTATRAEVSAIIMRCIDLI